MRGIWTFTLKDLNGKVINKQVKNNDITYLGVGYVLDRGLGRANVLALNAGSTWIAVGTGSATFTNWDSKLTTEVSGAGNPGRLFTDVNSRNNYKALVSATLDINTGSGALTEAGIFVKGYSSGNVLSSPSITKDSGLMFNKVVYGVINKDENNTLQIDVEVNLND